MQKNFARLTAMLALATLLVLVACGGPAPVEPPSTDGGGGSSGGAGVGGTGRPEGAAGVAERYSGSGVCLPARQ